MNRALVFVIAVMAASWSSPARGAEGVVEINQARVRANGGHFPFVISQPGSYKLTSDLDVTNDPGNPALAQNRTAIQSNAVHVTIDLNGFSLIGPVNCSGGLPVPSCTPSGGSGAGVLGANFTTV